MSETQGEFTSHPLGWEAQEAKRIKNLPRDELIHQVDSESDSQQELIERLATMVLMAIAVQLDLATQLGDACVSAKAWKAKAKHDRREWMADTGQRPWWLRKGAQAGL